MGKAKISIIIPVYNHGKELSKCLDSIFEQTFCDFEIIIVNDGSTDGVENIINEYIKRKRQQDLSASTIDIKVINQENQGAPSARNRGFNEAKGDFLLFCDADIEFRKDALEKMIKVLEKSPTAAYVYR